MALFFLKHLIIVNKVLNFMGMPHFRDQLTKSFALLKIQKCKENDKKVC